MEVVLKRKLKNSIGKRELDRKEEKVFLLAACLDSQLGLSDFFISSSSIVSSFSFVFLASLFLGDFGVLCGLLFGSVVSFLSVYPFFPCVFFSSPVLSSSRSSLYFQALSGPVSLGPPWSVPASPTPSSSSWLQLDSSQFSTVIGLGLLLLSFWVWTPPFTLSSGMP